jgi:hypothetical protein
MSTASLAQIRRQVTQAWIRTRPPSIEALATTTGRGLEEIRSLYPDIASVERDGLRALVDVFREVTWPALAAEMADQPVAHRLTSAAFILLDLLEEDRPFMQRAWRKEALLPGRTATLRPLRATWSIVLDGADVGLSQRVLLSNDAVLGPISLYVQGLIDGPLQAKDSDKEQAIVLLEQGLAPLAETLAFRGIDQLLEFLKTLAQQRSPHLLQNPLVDSVLKFFNLKNRG